MQSGEPGQEKVRSTSRMMMKGSATETAVPYAERAASWRMEQRMGGHQEGGLLHFRGTTFTAGNCHEKRTMFKKMLKMLASCTDAPVGPDKDVDSLV